MSSHLVFNGVDDTVKSRLEAYWARKLPRLEKLLVNYPSDLREVRLTVTRHEQGPMREWYDVRGVIELPTGTLAAEADDKRPEAALDRLADELVQEIKRHRELVRQDYLYKRKNRLRSGLRTAVAMLNRDHERGRKEDFLRLLRLYLRDLRHYAKRELRVLEEQGLLHHREANLADLIDEVLTLAWERWKDRPRRMGLDLWLIDLANEVLEQWIKQEPRPHISLEEKGRDKVHSHEDEHEWWEEVLGEEETLRLEDLLPDKQASEAWDEQEARHQRNRLLALLGELPVAQRQAFLLNVLEDYSPAEIAQIQDRPESEVKADIEAARQTLRERLQAEGYLQGTDRQVAVASGSSAKGGK